jgi:hypothetical protein
VEAVVVQKKKDTAEDDPYRRLLKKVAEKRTLRDVLRDVGILDDEVKISQWINGRLDRKRKPYFPPLNGETREKLFAFLKEHYAREVAEIEEAPTRALFEEAARKPILVRAPSDLDKFVDYLNREGTIASVTRKSIRADSYYSGVSGIEGTSREYGPPGGLDEEMYRRIASDDVRGVTFDDLESIAWCVIENLLLNRGLTETQIQQARGLVPKEKSIIDAVEAHSFETVANFFATHVPEDRASRE